MFRDSLQFGLVSLSLFVDGTQKYSAIGYGGSGFAFWKGTLKNIEIKTDRLSMSRLPQKISSATDLIKDCAEQTYQRRDIQVIKYINGVAA